VFRRRRASDLLVFDLHSDGAVETPVVQLGDPEPEPPKVHLTPAQRRTRLVAAGGVLAVAVGAWGITTAVDEHRRTELLLTAPGGVRSLAGPPEVVWSVDTDAADSPLFMPGLVVVRQGTELVAFDVETADERWRADVGGDPTCGSASWGRGGLQPRVADPIVCWSGPNAERSTVTVVDADGRATVRDVDDGWSAVAPGPGASLVLARRTGSMPPPPDITFEESDGGWEVSGTLGRGRDAEVRVEDAAAGEVRWERSVEFGSEVSSAWGCTTIEGDGTGERPVVDRERLAVLATPEFVQVQGCGITQAFAPSGQPLSDVAATAWFEVEPYADGGALQHVGLYDVTGVSDVLYDDRGQVVATFPAALLNPWATDGTDTDVRLIGTAGVTLRRVDEAGEELWGYNRPVTDLLVRAGGVGVVAQTDGELAGIDLGTGEPLWRDEDVLGIAGTGAWFGAPGYVRGVFTDGTLALVETYDHDGTGQLVAFEIATGDVRWRVPKEGESHLAAVDGRLVRIEGEDRSSFTQEDGVVVRRSPGTVRLLA
jgi:outer membrane protein assembly factor BamB